MVGGRQGVSELIEKWKDAYTEQGWRDYWVSMGPGANW